MRLEVEQHVAAPRASVWELLCAWERQPEWMIDALAVHVLTPQRTGTGVLLRCPTRLLGITVQDVMRVTVWEPPARLGVRHLGRIITGDAVFELRDAEDGGTWVRWREDVAAPLAPVGDWAVTLVVLPLLRRIFARSLRRLARTARAETWS